MRNIAHFLLAGALFGLTACNKKDGTQEAPKFLDVANMDTTVKPGDDFFQYANGTWLNNTPIPPSKTTWGSFGILDEENTNKLKILLEDMAAKKDAAAGSKEQKLGDFYASGMDTATLDKKSWEPVKPLLEKIDGVKDAKELFNLSASWYRDGFGSMLGTYVSTDDKNSSQYTVIMYQSGTGLPEKEYYLSQDSGMKAIREAYLGYIETLFTLTGKTPEEAKKIAADVLKLETEFAKSHKSMVELRDPVANYNKMSVEQLAKLAPNLDWATIFAGMGIKTDSVVVGQPNYYKKLSEVAKSASLDVLKNRFKFSVLSSAASYMSKPFEEANFNFYERTLNGRQAPEPRWQRISGVVDGSLGDLLGQAYVEKHFSADAKKRMLELVNNLQAAFKTRIENLSWMSGETKTAAIKKLGTIMNKIGYPDTWKSYDDVTVKRDDYFGNIVAANRHGWNEMVNKLGKPVDRTEWGMTPPTVNAYYNPGFNEIVFPAGILQFPFFDNAADDAINYGAIGAVIGHELTHGFDDQGSLFDEKGNMRNWWTDEDRTKFEALTGKLVEQYNGYTVLNGELHVNGSLTLGENIADLGGVLIAYDAFKMTPQGKGLVMGSDKIDGFNPDQRFFLSYAQVWRFKATDEAVRVRIMTDPHSPAHWRVNGTLSNVPAFYSAFNVQPGQQMYRADSNIVRIW